MNLGYKQDFNTYTIKYGVDNSGYTNAANIVAIGDSDLFGVGANTGIGASIGLNITSNSKAVYSNLSDKGITTTDLQGYYLHYATYYRPDILIVYTGFEMDITGGISNTTILTNIATIDTQCKQLGCTMFIANGKPASSFTSAQLTQATSLKNSINSTYGNRVIDTWDALIDTATGIIKVAYNADGLHYNDAGVTACMTNYQTAINNYFVINTGYTSYSIESSIDNVNYSVVQSATTISQNYNNSGLTSTKYYRVRGILTSGSYDTYSNVISVSTPPAIDFAISGGITDTSAVIKSKLNYTNNAPVLANSDLSIMRLNWDGTTYSGYINNTLVFSTTGNTGHFAYVYNMMIGSDADSTSFVSGYIPEIIVYNNPLSLTDSTNLEHWLADKWLMSGTSFNGYTVGAAQGIYPTISNTKWLHFDETTYVTSGSSITHWNDKANFDSIQKVGTPLATANQPTLQTNAFKGKATAQFAGNQNFKVGGLSDSLDPNYYTFFLVFKLNNFNLSTDETIIGTIDNNTTSPTYNNAIRIKKYATDGFISTRSYVSNGYIYGNFPQSSIYTLVTSPSVLVGNQRLMYSTNSGFTTSTYTPMQACYTGGNAIATYSLTGLTSGTTYYGKVEVNGVLQPDLIKFRTFKTGAYSFNIVAGSCNKTSSITPTWDRIKQEDPEIFLHIGDLHYENINSTNISNYREALNRVSYAPNLRALWMNTPFFYMYDNHDGTGVVPTKYDIGWNTVFNYYGENFPTYPMGTINPFINGWFQSFKIGRVFCIVTDMRSQRDSIFDPQTPSKSTLGVTQKAWVKAQLLQASLDPTIATIIWYHTINWNVDINSEYGLSYQAGGQSSWGSYDNEQKEMGSFLYNNNIQNVLMVCGDSHEQAIDDGRNSTFILDRSGNRVNNLTLPDGLKTVCMEASPFDQYTDVEGGAWQTDTPIQSGGIYPQYEQSYGKIKVIDEGKNWIQINLETWGYNPTTSTWVLTHAYAYNRPAIGSFGLPPALPETVSSLTELSGQIQLPATTTFTTTPIVMQITSPLNLIQGYTGAITGQVVNTSFTNKIVKAYRKTDAEYIYGTYTVASDGSFTVPGSIGQGTIVLRLFDTTTNSQIGIPVIASTPNKAVYSDLQVELYITTDIDYLQQVQPLTVNNTYDFIFPPSTNGGKAKVKLRQISTNTVLATSNVRGVLPRSYELETGDPNLSTSFASKDYLYDGSLALIAAVGTGNYQLADEIVNGVFLSQINNGGFPFSVNDIAPQGADTYFRTGAVAWVAYALGYFLQIYPSSINYNKVVTALGGVLSYLNSLIDNTRYNLFKGGSGLYTMSGSTEIFNASYIVPWVSTEHNIDSYFAFKQAGKVLNNTGYTATANALASSIITNLYDSINHKMYQGVNSDGTKDTSDALDINSWGSLFMLSAGRPDIATVLLNRINQYYYCADVNTGAKGYKPYNASLGYPSATDTVWFEGSFGVALANYRAGNIEKYSRILKQLFAFVEADGSFRYATLRDATYEITSNKSIASTAWAVIADTLKDSVWL